MFSVYYRVLASTILLYGSLAQVPAPPPLALMEGSVINKITGAPVKNARVMYIKVASGSTEAQPPIRTDTDSEGHFAIQLDPGAYRLWVERAGFSRQTYGSRTPHGQGLVLTLEPGQQVRDLTMQMVPLGAIAGRVFDEAGEPLQGVAIQVLRYSYATGKRQLIPVAGTTSNDRGEYRAYNLPAGRYFLLASRAGLPLSHPPEANAITPEVQEPVSALYYPGVLDLDLASQIVLAEGGERNDVDFQLLKVPAVTVRGRLLSPVSDFADSQLQVVLAHNDGNSASYINRTSAALDKATGRFEVRDVAPGSYLLIASQLYQGHAFGGRASIEVSAAPPENVTVALTSAFEVTGNVQVEGSPGKLPSLTLALSPTEGLALGPQPSSKTGPEGNIRLSGITPGVWDLALTQLPEGLWIKSALFGDMDVLRADMHIAGAPSGQLQVVLAGHAAQLSGTVVETNGSHQATVVLVPAAEDLRRLPQMYHAASTQDNGAFTLKGISPGSYKLFAFEDVEPFSWLDPDFLKPVEALGESISIGEGERLTRQLTPISYEALLPSH